MFFAQDFGRTMGFFTLGPFGAFYYGAIGKSIDEAMGSIDAQKPSFKIQVTEAANSDVQKSFFVSTFRIMGDVFLKCGFHRMNELKRLHGIMEHMELTLEHRKDAINNYSIGQKKAFNAENQIRKLFSKCEDNKNILKMFVEIQLQAVCDEYNDYNKTGMDAIKQFANILSISDHELGQIQALVKKYINDNKNLSIIQEKSNAYKTLGVSKATSTAEIKKCYKALMSQHHPDKLVGRGLPSDMEHIATEKIKSINDAYKLIIDTRKKRN